MGCGHSTAAVAVPLGKLSSKCIAVVDGIVLDPEFIEELSASQHLSPQSFRTLLEAFKYCDPSGTGVISDIQRLRQVTAHLIVGRQQSTRSILELAKLGLLPRQLPLNLPDFVSWARSNDVTLPLGLPDSTTRSVAGENSAGTFPFPCTWMGPKDDPFWNRRHLVQDAAHLAELQELLDATYKKIWTRDRKTTGINQVPDEYRLESALQSENYDDWCAYYSKRMFLLDSCRRKPGFMQIQALTCGARRLHGRHRLGDASQNRCNEYLLFHGTDQNAAKAICASDFSMDLAGNATGTLYGKGTYFSESITKADEYAKEDEDGLCCVLVCRVACGRMLYNGEQAPDGSHLQRCVLSGVADSVLGDRESTRNTFREFVVFSTDQVYIEYVLFYRRIFKTVAVGGESHCPSGAVPGTESRRSLEFAGFGVVGLDLDDAQHSPGSLQS